MKHSDIDVTEVRRNVESSECRGVGQVLSRVGEKWNVLIIVSLADGPRRFTQLKRSVEGISQRMLTLCLRNLERDGIVRRTVFATVPPRVDYELTDLGLSLRGPVCALGSWALEHMAEIEAARAAFDRREGGGPG